MNKDEMKKTMSCEKTWKKEQMENIMAMYISERMKSGRQANVAAGENKKEQQNKAGGKI